MMEERRASCPETGSAGPITGSRNRGGSELGGVAFSSLTEVIDTANPLGGGVRYGNGWKLVDRLRRKWIADLFFW